MTVRFPRVHSLEEAAKNLLPNTGVCGQWLARPARGGLNALRRLDDRGLPVRDLFRIQRSGAAACQCSTP